MEELRSFLNVIENKDFQILQTTWRSRTSRFKDDSRIRIVEGADLVYYDPVGKRLIDEATAERRNWEIRFVPVGHPVGYEYSEDVVV